MGQHHFEQPRQQRVSSGSKTVRQQMTTSTPPALALSPVCHQEYPLRYLVTTVGRCQCRSGRKSVGIVTRQDDDTQRQQQRPTVTTTATVRHVPLPLCRCTSHRAGMPVKLRIVLPFRGPGAQSEGKQHNARAQSTCGQGTSPTLPPSYTLGSPLNTTRWFTRGKLNMHAHVRQPHAGHTMVGRAKQRTLH